MEVHTFTQLLSMLLMTIPAVATYAEHGAHDNSNSSHIYPETFPQLVISKNEPSTSRTAETVLFPQQELPNPADWGWKKGSSYQKTII